MIELCFAAFKCTQISVQKRNNFEPLCCWVWKHEGLQTLTGTRIENKKEETMTHSHSIKTTTTFLSPLLSLLRIFLDDLLCWIFCCKLRCLFVVSIYTLSECTKKVIFLLNFFDCKYFFISLIVNLVFFYVCFFSEFLPNTYLFFLKVCYAYVCFVLSNSWN